MRNKLISTVILTMCLIISADMMYAAVGCTLKDPDRDIEKLFPGATGYKTEYITVRERGGSDLLKKIEKKLGDKLDPVYEADDVPYAYYNVLKGKELVGRVHGVNEKGRYGGMQIILATDLDGVIMSCYFQRISSPESKAFRASEFTDLFKGMSLDDFEDFHEAENSEKSETRVGKIKDPSAKSGRDFKAALRGIMKNLILLDEFMFEKTEKNKEGSENETDKKENE